MSDPGAPLKGRVLSAREVGNPSPWQPARVGGASRQDPAPARASHDAAELERLRDAARAEGFARGLEEGRAVGRDELIAKGRQLEPLLRALSSPMAELDAALENEVVTMIQALTRQLVRREIKADPGQIVAVVREALGALPVVTHNARIHLHPDDVALLDEVRAGREDECRWQLVGDPLISRGGCRVETDDSRVDATVEHRMAMLFAQVFGDERQGICSAPEALSAGAGP